MTSRPRTTDKPQTVEDGPVSLAISHVDSLLEKIRHNKVKLFDINNLSHIKSLGSKEIKIVNHQYETTLETMKEALAGEPYSVEAYGHFTNLQLKLAVEYLKNLRTLKHDDSSSKLRKTIVRRKKEKAPSVVVKKVLFLQKDSETGIEGITPEALVGAQQMWVYNSKTRKLGCYYAKNDSGLTAKGTTVLNYQEEKSTWKTLRKPKEQLRKFMSTGLKFWDSIKAVPQQISPRLSRETLILKVA